MSKKKQSINYLDLIPQRAETLRWHTDEATLAYRIVFAALKSLR